MNNLDKIIDLLNQKKFSEAEEILLKLRKKDPRNEVTNYFLGIIYNDFNNPNKSNEKAKRYFGYAIDSDNPIEKAFIKLAHLEKNASHAGRILRKGLEKFPKSVKLYEELLWKTETTKRDSIFEEIARKGITSNNILIIELETHFKQERFDDALNIASRIELTDREEVKILHTVKAYCYLEINDVKKSGKSISRINK